VSAAYVGSKGTHLALYDSQINQLGDNFFSPQAAPQCAAQSASHRRLQPPRTARHLTRGARGPPTAGCRSSGSNFAAIRCEPLLRSGDPEPRFALSGPTTTNAQLARPYPQYTGLKLAGQGDYDSIYHSLQLTLEPPLRGRRLVCSLPTPNSKLITNADNP